MLARAFALEKSDVPSGVRAARAARGGLRAAMRDAGWSTQSFMFPELRVRADWSHGASGSGSSSKEA